MIFGTHIALDNSDHVLDGGPNPPHWGGFLQNVPRHNGGFTKRTTSRSGRPSSAVAELLYNMAQFPWVIVTVDACACHILISAPD